MRAHAHIQGAFTLGMRMTGGWKRREGENGGRNLGRPAPRAARKLGQVFCTCRSNAGTFAATLIVVIVTFRFPIFHPLSFPIVVFFFASVRLEIIAKGMAEIVLRRRAFYTLKGKSMLHLKRGCFEISHFKMQQSLRKNTMQNLITLLCYLLIAREKELCLRFCIVL